MPGEGAPSSGENYLLLLSLEDFEEEDFEVSERPEADFTFLLLLLLHDMIFLLKKITYFWC